MADASGQPQEEPNKRPENSAPGKRGSDGSIPSQKPIVSEKDKEFESIIEGLEATSKAFRILKKDHDASSKEAEDLRRQNQALTALNQSLNGRISDLEAENKKAHEKIEHLNEELSECKGIKEGYEVLRKEYESLKAKLDKIPKITY